MKIKIGTNPNDQEVYALQLEGTIEEGDFDKILHIIESRRSFPEKVTILTSKGGNVDEAMRIGRLFRRGIVKVESFAGCSSACFLIWIGAGIRESVSGFETFNLHRPYYSPEQFSELPLEQANQKYAEIEHAYRAYLDEMGTPRDLIDTIMLHKSTSAFPIQGKDLLASVGAMPPPIQEWLIASCGELSDAEVEDLKFVNTLINDEKNIVTLDEKTNEADPELKDFLAERIRVYSQVVGRMSDGYRQYLLDKQEDIGACTRQEIRKHQATLFEDSE